MILGIDIGGTKTAFGFVDAKGVVVAKDTIATTGHTDIDAYVAAVKAAGGALMKSAGVAAITGIGIGAPNGNFYTGEVAFAPNLPWKGIIPLKSLFEQAFGIQTIVTNDANAAAMGEKKYGAAQGMKDFIFVTLGTGLGSGFVANGEMIYGHNGFAGELGHVIVDRSPAARLCGCGRKGCLERYASATGIVITAGLMLAEDKTDSLLRDKIGVLTAKDIHEAAEQNDELALAIFDYTARILGQALADAVAITEPEAIILFGGLANAGDYILKPAQHYMEENLLAIYKGKVKVIRSTIPDNDAAILGAAALIAN